MSPRDDQKHVGRNIISLNPLLRTIVLAILLVTTLPVGVIARPGDPSTVKLQSEVVAPNLSATGAIAIDLDAGIELFGKNADTPYPPASTAKMLTALVVREIFELQEVIEIQESDVVTDEEISRVGLLAGDQVTVEQLLYGLLIPSGSDAARALARAGGSKLDPQAPDPVARFVAEMNAMASRIGMNDSNFVNPTGLDHPEMYATARDLARAGARVLEDTLLARIVGSPTASVTVGGPNAREIEVQNTNDLVLIDGAIGVKTGTEDEAGQCLVNAYWYAGHRVMTVVLGSQDRYADTAAMLGAVESHVRWLRVGGDHGALGVAAVLAEQGLWIPVSRTLVLTAEQADRVTYTIELNDGGPVGRQRGSVSFTLDGELLAKLPIYSEQDRPKG